MVKLVDVLLGVYKTKFINEILKHKLPKLPESSLRACVSKRGNPSNKIIGNL